MKWMKDRSAKRLIGWVATMWTIQFDLIKWVSGLRVSHEVTEQVGEILASMSDPGREWIGG